MTCKARDTERGRGIPRKVMSWWLWVTSVPSCSLYLTGRYLTPRSQAEWPELNPRQRDPLAAPHRWGLGGGPWSAQAVERDLYPQEGWVRGSTREKKGLVWGGISQTQHGAPRDGAGRMATLATGKQDAGSSKGVLLQLPQKP